MNKLLKHFSELGTKYDLLFSSQTILKDCVIGLDGINRKILILSAGEETPDHLLIDVDEINSCSVRKSYGRFTNNRLKRLNLDQYLEEIVLRFDLKTSITGVEITFYKYSQTPFSRAKELEQKAKDLEIVISKMRGRRVNQKINLHKKPSLTKFSYFEN